MATQDIVVLFPSRSLTSSVTIYVTILSAYFRESVSDGCAGNQFVIFDDVPLYWDAWDVMDYHLQTRSKSLLSAHCDASQESVKQTLKTDSTGSPCWKWCILFRWCPRVGFEAASASPSGSATKAPSRRRSSWMPCVLTSSSTPRYSDVWQCSCLLNDPNKKFISLQFQVQWAESHKFLKVEFPVRVRSNNATYEIQFGHLQRPTHWNTSWDWARFEVRRTVSVTKVV